MKSDQTSEILRRLDTIVFLLLELKDREGAMPIREKVRLLNNAGLDYLQIAKVLGKTSGNIAVQLNILKKAPQNKKLSLEFTEQKEDKQEDKNGTNK